MKGSMHTPQNCETAKVCELAGNQGFAVKKDGFSSSAENEAFELEKLNKNKGLQENTSLCPRWLGVVDNLRTHYAEIKGLKSRAETLRAILRSAA